MKKEGWLKKGGFIGFSRVYVVLRGGVLSFSDHQVPKNSNRTLMGGLPPKKPRRTQKFRDRSDVGPMLAYFCNENLAPKISVYYTF